MKKVEVRDKSAIWKHYHRKGRYTTHVVYEGYIGQAGESTTTIEKDNFVNFCKKYNVDAIHELVRPVGSKVIGSRSKSLSEALLHQLVMPVESSCAIESRDGRFYVMWLMKKGEDELLLPHGHIADNKWLGCYGDNYYTAKMRSYIPEEASFLKDRQIILWEVVKIKK